MKDFKGLKVVVTGGGGYFGLRLGYALQKKGADVVLFDLKEPESYEGLKFCKGNVCNKSDVHFALEGATFVFHSASYGMSGREQLNKTLIEQVNVQGTKNIVAACQSHSIPYLVYTSTYNVVFGHDEIRNGNESLPYLPMHQHTDHYSRTKSIAEQFVLSANDSLKLQDGNLLKTTALRPAGIYGEGELRHLPRIVSYIERGLFAFTYGNEDNKVDFVHVDNLVLAHVQAGQALTGINPIAAGQAYFISDGRPTNNFEFFRPLVEGLGYTFPTINLPIKLIYVIAFLTELIHSIVGRYIYNFQPILTRTEVHKTGVTHYFSINKARNQLGYNPIPHDLKGVVKYFRKRGHGKKVARKQSGVLYFIVNIIIAIIFASLLLSWLPLVKT